METLQDLVNSLSARGNKPATCWKDENGNHTITFQQLHERIQNYSLGFLEFGLQKGDRVALFAGNVPEWIGLNLGITNAGLIDAPRGEDAPGNELDYVLDNSDAKVIIVQDESVLAKIDKDGYKHCEIFSIKETEKIPHISVLNNIGKTSSMSLPEVSSNDLAGFIYTSGTTGEPKGAMLTHGNFMSNIGSVLKRVAVKDDDLVLSMLPPWHSMERIIQYIAVASGATTFHSSKERILQDFAEQRPTIMASVPKIWEKVYDGVMAKIENKGRLQRAIVLYAISQSIMYTTENKHSSWKQFWHQFADKKVYSQLREKLGGRFRLACSGGGALPPHIDKFYYAASIKILEGYGMTETAAMISMRNPDEFELHTVGTLIDGVEGKLFDPDTGKEIPLNQEGVLHVRGPNVMQGYHKNPSETEQVLKDGWMDTGDLGYFDENQKLRLTGRAKEIIILNNAENIGPVFIESALKISPYIEDVIVLGQDWKGLGALIVPEIAALKNYCMENGIEFRLDNPEIRQFYEKNIASIVNTKKGFRHFHLVRDFELVEDGPWEPGVQITSTLKPMRRKINKHYEDKINAMYQRLHDK